MDKLQERYQGKFSTEKSMNRDGKPCELGMLRVDWPPQDSQADRIQKLMGNEEEA